VDTDPEKFVHLLEEDAMLPVCEECDQRYGFVISPDFDSGVSSYPFNQQILEFV
jgi:hypothetical protein